MNGIPIEAASRDQLQEALLGHYDRTARELPWRRDTDPYRVLVSEIMLQQTRVETVREYYERWLVRFPRLEDLAAADEEDVLKAWEGLGYYRRARNLHTTAMIVCEDHGGMLPSDSVGLRALPGIGEYTSGAVSSIAFGERVPAVDGNVRRVLARFFDVAEPRASWLRETADQLVDGSRPGDWNQALMELGATVCTPRKPACSSCPLSPWCQALAAGTQAERPAPARARKVPRSVFVLAVLHAGGRVLIAKRPAGGLLAGLWAFPESVLESGSPESDARAVALRMAETLGYRTIRADELPTCTHRFTHLEAVYIPWAVEVLEPETDVGTGYAWLDAHGPDDRALPVAQRRVFRSWLALHETPEEM
jgi:A/G-specific adenine glycosylase